MTLLKGDYILDCGQPLAVMGLARAKCAQQGGPEVVLQPQTLHAARVSSASLGFVSHLKVPAAHEEPAS